MAGKELSKTEQIRTEEQGVTTALVEATRSGADVAADIWYDMARDGQRKTLGALRQCVDLTAPLQGGKDSRRRRLIDGAFALADQAGEAQLALARGAMRGAMVVYMDIAVNVSTDFDALSGISVDVSVPTDVKTASL